MLNQNQNAAPLLLSEVTTTRAARIEAAHARHAISTAGTWTATPEGIRPPIHRQNAAQLYRTADTAVYLAVRARHQSSGVELFGQLLSSAKADNVHRYIERIAAEAIAAERERDEQRKKQHHHEQQAERKTISPADAQAHKAKAKKAKKAAEDAEKTAKGLNDIIKAATASDREPLVQAAIIAALEADPNEPDAIFPAMCAAAGREIANIAAPDAAQSTKTKVKEISPERAAELRKAYPDIIITDPITGLEIATPCRIPHNVKGATSQCFDTVELRERGRKPNRRLVWCLVSHYLTVAPYVSYEAFQEQSGGDTSEIATNGGINAIGTQEDQAAITDLLERANLTEREQAIVYKVADQTAARHGQYAANEYWKKRTPEIAAIESKKERNKAHKAAQETADNKRTAAQWANAFDRSKVHSDRTRRDIKKRIDERLHGAMHPAEALTKEEQEERTARQWEQMQRNSRRQCAPAIIQTPDYIGAVCPESVPVGNTLDFVPGEGWKHRPTKSARVAAAVFEGRPGEHKPVIRWTEGAEAPEAITPGIDYRAAEIERRAAQKGGQATAPAMTERERKQWEKLCKREEELFDLWRKFEQMNGRTPDTTTRLPQADTTSAAALAEREQMRAAANAPGLTRIKDRR